MTPVIWILIGAATAMVVAAPFVFVLLRSAGRRAREAEGEARHSQRLAELGAMSGGLAHEIKNPLSTVGLNAQLLIEDLQHAELDEDEKARLIRRVETLRREVDRLAGILTDFLEFAGRVQLHRESHDLRSLVTDLADFFNPQCDQANVILRVSVPQEPIEVVVDERLFKQAMLNLMINAVQAMTGDDAMGQAACELLIAAQDAGDAVRISVADTGPGIDSDRLETIFHPYVSGRRGGTGLGLPTTRRIIEEHGGSLVVSSERGRGTEFVIELPKSKSRLA